MLALVMMAALPASAQTFCRIPLPQLDAWTLSWMQLPTLLLGVLYVLGLRQLWRGGRARGVGRWAAAAFGIGLLGLVLVLGGPLRGYAGWSLAAHVAQHMLLLALVPPLLLAGQPSAVVASALPARWSGRVYRGLRPLQTRLGDALAAATFVHCAVMWLWHAPQGLQRALENEALHWLMHLSFLLAGLWFWAVLWRRIRDPQGRAVSGAAALVVVMMQMGFIGALLTFSPRPLYPVYIARVWQLGLDPLLDQQLAGLVMWVPSGLPYLLGLGWLLWRSFARLERAQRAGAAAATPANSTDRGDDAPD